MKNFNKWTLLLYAAQILILVAAIVLAVRLLPDFGEPARGLGEEAASRSEAAAAEETETDNSRGEEGQRGPEQENPEEAPEEETAENETPSDTESGRTGAGIYGRQDAAQTDALPQETEYVYRPPVMAVASDLHYMSPTMTDFGMALERYTEWDDGKVVPYLDQITDAFLEEIVALKPSVLVLSGDISSNGEKVNHGELARKLRRVQKAGVPVAVIPGNHDINHPWAATYYGNDTVPSETVDADGFLEIYHEFGYDQAVSKDEASLSYLYQVDERYWLMMLDTCIYYPENQVGGRIKSGTLAWMEQWLLKAQEQQVTVIPVGHHNLLNESALYQEECTLQNNRQVIALLEEYGVPVYISGHLHLQRVKKNINSPTADEAYGIREIVSGSLSTPPCQYGILNWSEDGSLSYGTKAVDVAGWAAGRGSQDENLLNFAEYSRQFLVDVIGTQVYRAIESVPEARKTEMAQLYGNLNSTYTAGRKINPRRIKETETYFFWERYMGNTKWFDRLTAILRDAGHDHNELKLKAGADFPAKKYE